MKFQIVVDDEDKAHEANLNVHYKDHSYLHKFLEKRLKGTIHTEVDSECPNGLPNCRNCGDPEFEESCESQNHCPDCGTKHGVAPNSVLLKNGYKLVEV